MIADKYLFIEPTLGIPIQPILAKKIITKSDFDSIIWLQFRDPNDHSCEYFQNLIGEKIHYLDEILSGSQIKLFREESLELTAESLKSIGNGVKAP